MSTQTNHPVLSSQLDLLLELTNDFVFVFDTEGLIQKVSRTVLTKLGYNAEDVLGQSVVMMHLPSDRDTANRIVGQMLSGAVDTCTLPLIDKQGRSVAVLTRVRSVEQDGEICIIGVSTPLSSVNDIEERFYQIFKTNQALMAITEFETGIFIEVNDAFAETLKMSKKDLIGHSSVELNLFTKKQREHIISQIDLNGFIHNYDVEIYRPYGIVFGSFSAEVLFWDDKKVLLTTFIDVTNQRQTAKALKDSNNRYRQLIEQLPEMICEVDKTGRIYYANAYSLNKFGYTLADIESGFYLHQIFATQEYTRLQLQFERLQFEDISVPSEYKAKTKDGRLFDSLVYSTRIFEDGKFVGIRGVLLDISSQKLADESLRLSEERLDLALKCADQGLWDWNIQTGEVYFSDRWATMLGYEVDELTPSLSTWEALVHPLDRGKVQEALQKHLAGLSQIYSTEHRVKTKRGDWLWIQDTGRVVEWDAKHRPLRAVGTHINIDEQKKAKLFLQNYLEQQEILSKILLTINSLNEFEVKIDQVLSFIGKYIGASRVFVFEDDFGGESTSNTHEWCDKNINSMQAELQCLPYLMFPSWHSLLTNEGKIVCSSVKNLPHDLQQFLLPQFVDSIIAYPLVVSECMYGFIGFSFNFHNTFVKNEVELLRTVTETIANAYERRNIERWLRNAKIEADNANRAKSEFLANMSHEIRTPLNAVLGISEALAQRTTDDYMRNKLQTINTSGKTLLSLINDILDLSRIESGRLEIMLSPLSLVSIIKEIINIFQHRAKEKGILLEYEIAADVPLVVDLDETRLRQLLFNLIGNAVKFTDVGSVRVLVSATVKKNQQYDIQIQVSDTGIGIPLNQQTIIFEAFRQQQGQDNRKYGGTGLGLAITKKLVELMQGEIRLQSQVSKGSTFTIRLFNVHSSGSAPVQTIVQRSFDTLLFDDATVLIIDDIPLNIETVELLNQSTKLKIIGKTSSNEALEWLKHNTPQLILCDIRMPEPDGWQVSEILKSDASWRHIPLVAYTASGTTHEQARISQCFDGLLLKPATQAAILTVFEKYLSHSEALGVEKSDIHILIQQTKSQHQQFISQLQQLCDTTEILTLEFIDIVQTENFAKQIKAMVEVQQVETLKAFANQFILCCETFDLEQIEQSKKLISTLIH